MMPNTVPSGRRKRSAGADDCSSMAVDRRRSASVEPFAGSRRAVTTCSQLQLVAPPTSMYSMKRNSAPRAFANSSRSISSSSLTPRMTTVSILSRGRAAAAASMPCAHAIELVVARQLDEAIVPERVEADRHPVQPGVLQRAAPSARAARRWSSSPDRRCRGLAASRSIEHAAGPCAAAARRRSSRTLRTPRSRKTSTSRSISSKCRMSSRGSHT